MTVIFFDQRSIYLCYSIQTVQRKRDLWLILLGQIPYVEKRTRWTSFRAACMTSLCPGVRRMRFSRIHLHFLSHQNEILSQRQVRWQKLIPPPLNDNPIPETRTFSSSVPAEGLSTLRAQHGFPIIHENNSHHLSMWEICPPFVRVAGFRCTKIWNNCDFLLSSVAKMLNRDESAVWYPE